LLKPSASLLQFLRRQQVFIVMGVVVYAMIVTLRIPVSLTGCLICSLICGNLTTSLLQWLTAACSLQRLPHNWLVFTGCLALATPITVTISIWVVGKILFPPDVLTWKNVGPWWEFSCVATMVFGLIYYAYNESRQRLERRNRELAQALDQGTARLEFQDQELQRAREIQESLLPRNIPQIDGFEIAGTWQPARTVGGDYFDILKFADDKLGFCIADVVGKGVSAALLMANIQAAVRAFASESARPAWLCARINSVLCGNIADDKFVTFFYGLLDARKRTLVYANAGHLPPILMRDSGPPVRLTEGGMVLGVSPSSSYKEAALCLHADDRLLLFTDGITEAADANLEEYGDQRIQSVAEDHIADTASELMARVMADATQFCQGQFVDDATMIVLAAVSAGQRQEATEMAAPSTVAP